MNLRKVILLPFFLTFLFYSTTAYADTPKNVIDSKSMDMLVREKVLENILTNKGKLDASTVKNILKSSVIKPQVRKTFGGYIFTTGKAGNASGKIIKGKYKVAVVPINGLDITVPAIVDATKGTAITIPVTITKGSGKVIYKKQSLSWFQRLLQLFKIQQASADKPAQRNPQATVVLYSKDKVLPWAGVNISLENTEQGKIITLNQGWNLITLPILPDKTLTASDLLFEITKAGGNASTVSTLENGVWKSYVVRDGKDFSQENFAIKSGNAYFIKALKKSVLILKGQELVAPVKLDLSPGWNSFGIPFSKTNYSASNLIDKLATPSGADTVSSWDSGLWDSFLKRLNQSFGNNFTIEKNKGYILKVGKSSQFSP